MLTLDAGVGQNVAMAGDFNDWTAEPMAKGSDGAWRLTVQLSRGTYEYRFLVDGEWREDPNNPRRIQNESGGYNSILMVL